MVKFTEGIYGILGCMEIFHEFAFPCYVPQLVTHYMKTNKQTKTLLEILISSLAVYLTLTPSCVYPRERMREVKKGNFGSVISFGTQGQAHPQSVI